MPLTDRRIRSLKPDRRRKRFSDGYGLYVEVRPGVSTLWRLAYRFEGKQKTLSLTRKLHTKPLPGPAIEILKDLKRFTGKGSLILPSQMSDGRPLSENTMNYALRRLDIQPDVYTCHGLRASASSLLNESGKWHPDAIEAELAHVGDNHVRQAYHRSTYWDGRVRMADGGRGKS
jgi:integrase